MTRERTYCGKTVRLQGHICECTLFANHTHSDHYGDRACACVHALKFAKWRYSSDLQVYARLLVQ